MGHLCPSLAADGMETTVKQRLGTKKGAPLSGPAVYPFFISALKVTLLFLG